MKKLLQDYFEKESIAALAFLFGSVAAGRETEESDVDVAVYLTDAREKDRIWKELGSLLGREVDLVCLNEEYVPATLISAIFKTGVPLAIKDKRLYWNLYLGKTMEAEDFSEFAESYWKISQRSK
jgi:uncharacterized protein